MTTLPTTAPPRRIPTVFLTTAFFSMRLLFPNPTAIPKSFSLGFEYPFPETRFSLTRLLLLPTITPPTFSPTSSISPQPFGCCRSLLERSLRSRCPRTKQGDASEAIRRYGCAGNVHWQPQRRGSTLSLVCFSFLYSSQRHPSSERRPTASWSTVGACRPAPAGRD